MFDRVLFYVGHPCGGEYGYAKRMVSLVSCTSWLRPDVKRKNEIAKDRHGLIFHIEAWSVRGLGLGHSEG